jgi:hypothetical protein
MKKTVLIVFMFVALTAPAISGEEFALTDIEGLKAAGVQVEAVEYLGRKSVRLSEVPGAEGELSLAILPGIDFQDGTIELELAGRPAPGSFEGARGFVGLAFRVAEDLSAYECFYIRPTNGRAEDQLRRNHSTQYISYPDYPWYRLREETPGKYESYVDLEPGAWTKIKIVVSGEKARLYVHGADQPSLIVNDLKHGSSRGSIALWLGMGSECFFSNLRIQQ